MNDDVIRDVISTFDCFDDMSCSEEEEEDDDALNENGGIKVEVITPDEEWVETAEWKDDEEEEEGNFWGEDSNKSNQSSFCANNNSNSSLWSLGKIKQEIKEEVLSEEEYNFLLAKNYINDHVNDRDAPMFNVADVGKKKTKRKNFEDLDDSDGEWNKKKKSKKRRVVKIRDVLRSQEGDKNDDEKLREGASALMNLAGALNFSMHNNTDDVHKESEEDNIQQPPKKHYEKYKNKKSIIDKTKNRKSNKVTKTIKLNNQTKDFVPNGLTTADSGHRNFLSKRLQKKFLDLMENVDNSEEEEVAKDDEYDDEDRNEEGGIQNEDMM